MNISDHVWELAITGLVTLGTIWLKRGQVVAADKQVITDAKVDTLQDTSDKQSIVVKDVHKLVNSKLGDVLQIGATSAQSLADLSGKESDRQLAKIANASLAEHQANQAIVDAASQPHPNPVDSEPKT